MSLLNEAMGKCTLVYLITVDDGRGGYDQQWIEGATFDAAITFDTSIEARMAEIQGVSSLYTVTISRDFILEYHNVFRRERDKKYFRVTSDGDDKYTPQSATLDMRQVTAEEYVPTGGVM